MIREHAFNSAWWGSPVGIVEDAAALVALAPDALQRALEPWSFVELRGKPDALPAPRALARCGFFQADTQLPFRIGLTQLASSPSLERLEVRFADDGPLRVDAERMAPFRHERFLQLPGIDTRKLAERYARWGALLIAEAPATCLGVYDDGELQGWFLSRPKAGSLHLTLAVLTADARVSGHHLYQRALLAYAQRGHRLGSAEFSASNTAVLNIYANLGARFLASEPCWLWLR